MGVVQAPPRSRHRPRRPHPATDNGKAAAGRPALLPLALREFLRTEAAGGLVLVVAAVVALVWANSPWADGYERLWQTHADLTIGGVGFTGDLRHLVNDGLMALFFFVVGLEIKRELVAGGAAALAHGGAAGHRRAGRDGGAGADLPGGRDARRARAAGLGHPDGHRHRLRGGVLALLGRRVPASLKLFLLTLAIVDDIGAIVVIAVFYAGGISFRRSSPCDAELLDLRLRSDFAAARRACC